MLTDKEGEAVAALGKVAILLADIIADGPTRRADMAELYGHVHALQNAVLSQAAARQYPDRYRLLGEALDPEPTPAPFVIERR